MEIPIPSENVDYREIAKMMRINIDFLKNEITEHLNSELERFDQEIRKIRDL